MSQWRRPFFCRFVTFGGASNLVGRPGGWTVSLSGHISSSGQRTTMIFGSNRIYSSTRTRSCKDRGLYPFLWRIAMAVQWSAHMGQKSCTHRIVLFRCNLESEGYNDCFEYPNASINQEAPSVFHMGYTSLASFTSLRSEAAIGADAIRSRRPWSY